MNVGKKSTKFISPLTLLKRRNKALLHKLEEAQDTLRALGNGEVDALVVSSIHGEQIFTLIHADQPYRNLVESMNEGAVTLSSDGSIFYCNRRFSEYMGIPMDLLIGLSVYSFVKPEELERFKGIFSNGRLSKNCSDDFSFILGEEKFIPLRITMSSTQIHDHQGVCMIATDLTQQNRQKEYEKITADLKEAVSARDEFISIASHELKTPLTTLIILSQLQKKMVDKKDPRAFAEERVSSMAEKTEASAIKLSILVEAMLDVTKIQDGKISLSKENMDIGKLTKSVLSRMSIMFTEAGCQQPKFQNSVIMCNWDPLRIEQVLNNLLVNAIKYGNKSAMEVSISQKEGVARVSVKDKGLGIPEADQLKIFGLYERAVSANEISGLGLGLYISQKIIQAHDGKIWVESKDGDGSTFIFEIPTGVS